MANKQVLVGNKPVVLKDADFLASGGEADVYVVAGKVYKVYTVPVNPKLLDKIQELSVLDRPNIIRPLDLIYSPTTGLAVGYTMAYADNAVGLPLMFTSSFLDRNSIKPQATQKLVQEMTETLQFIHSRGILVVDGNEFNHLVSKNGYTQPFFIDTDSYQTPSFPATVIMPSVRDYRNPKFTELTDWYSQAVVTFQLFTGIHPYKGKHDALKTVEERRKALVSVFDPSVRLPATVRDFNAIPANYLKWYRDVFQGGQQVPPPNMISTPTVAVRRTHTTANFVVQKVFATEGGENIIHAEWIAGTLVASTADFTYVGARKYAKPTADARAFFGDQGTLYFATTVAGTLVLRKAIGDQIVPNVYLKPTAIFTIQGRLYVIDDTKLYEMAVREQVNAPAFKITSAISVLSSKVFDGVVAADLFGEKYFYLLPQTGFFVPFQAKALKGYKVWDAALKGNRLQVVVTDQAGDAHIVTYTMSKSWGAKEEAIAWEAIQGIRELNTAVLASGVVVDYDAGEDEVKLSSGTQVKTVTNAGLPQGAQLLTDTQSVYFVIQDEIRKLSMK